MQKASVLTEALPYIQDFAGSSVLVKVGGSVMENEVNLDSLLADIAFMDAVGMKVVLVHGGGKAISKAIKESGHEPRFVDGLRVTDEPTMEIVRRTLNNVVNADLVRRLQKLKTNARPLHGNWMFTAEKLENPDRGYVGEPVEVDTRAVCEMLDAGIVPVVTPTDIFTISTPTARPRLLPRRSKCGSSRLSPMCRGYCGILPTAPRSSPRFTSRALPG